MTYFLLYTFFHCFASFFPLQSHFYNPQICALKYIFFTSRDRLWLMLSTYFPTCRCLPFSESRICRVVRYLSSAPAAFGNAFPLISYQLQHISAIQIVCPQLYHFFCTTNTPAHRTGTHSARKHMAHMRFCTAPNDSFFMSQPQSGCCPVGKDVFCRSFYRTR